MKLSFLLIGISFDLITDPEINTKVREMLKRDNDNFKQAGLDYEMVVYHPDESMDRLENILKERQGGWSGICIGNGIRSQAKFTALFERLVNTIHDKSPGTKFIFNTMPDNTLDAAKRVFPELEGSAGKDEL